MKCMTQRSEVKKAYKLFFIQFAKKNFSFILSHQGELKNNVGGCKQSLNLLIHPPSIIPFMKRKTYGKCI